MKLKTILHPLVVSIREFKDKSKQRVYCNSEFSQRIEKLKNINQGKRCFIIGNGPSLKIEDLNALVDEDCFACNRIYGLYFKLKIDYMLYGKEKAECFRYGRDDIE